MPEFQNRTLICSVLFIDIVEYSRKSVIEQGQLKDRFNTLLSEALRGVAVNDRIILDTGDGAAISFIGDPEDALFVATGLRDVITELPQDGRPLLSIRMGINLGPVRLVKDIDGLPNIIGDGINVSQRVMTFARPGQVLVSRSYYEVVSRLSDESSKLFSYEGARTDKHIREHEVYAVGSFAGPRKRYDGSASGELPPVGGPRRAGLVRIPGVLRRIGGYFGREPRLATLIVVFAILVVAVGARSYRASDELHPLFPSQPQARLTPSPALTEASVAEKLPPMRGLPPEPAQAQPAPSVADSPPQPEPRPEAAAAAPAPASDKKVAKASKAREKPRQELVAQASPAPPLQELPQAPAMVSFAISPWGEVYVDGKLAGVSPPLQELELAAGRHRIEFRNSASQPHTVTITAKPGERIRIKHKFN